MISRDHPVLPDNATYSYLAEGAANIVYKICVTPEVSPESVDEEGEIDISQQREGYLASISQPNEFKDQLLRVRKNLPTTFPCEESHAAWLRLIAPLFRPDQILEQSLVRLHPPGLLTRLNAELRSWEQNPNSMKPPARSLDHRPKSRQGIYLADDEYGLLITDMTCSRKKGEGVVEFKPKWLTQSLSAPANSKRCRQCAHVARANAKRSRTGEPLAALFCPLDLVSESPADLRLVASQLIARDRSEATIERFAKWLETDTLLRKLRSYQRKLDRRGVLIGDVADEDLLAAMTLRDCTVFVKFPPAESGGQIEARLGDLDLKSRAKKEYWRRTELALIDEGWYEGTESEESRQPSVCQLSPERRGREEVRETIHNK